MAASLIKLLVKANGVADPLAEEISRVWVELCECWWKIWCSTSTIAVHLKLTVSRTHLAVSTTDKG